MAIHARERYHGIDMASCGITGADLVVETLGELVRRRRKELSLRQEQLAEMIGKDQSYVSELERGKIRRPDPEVLEALAHQLGLPKKDLIELSGWVYREIVTGEERTVPVLGRVPADVVRWASPGEATVSSVHVLAEDVRGAQDAFALEVSGDCLRSLGIFHGDVVIVEPARGRWPRNGQLVVVRVGDEVSLKRWVQIAEGIALEDGEGNVVYRLQPGKDDFEVLGFYLTFRPLAPR
jgi:SOS-response transcriptional repressor LexA